MSGTIWSKFYWSDWESDPALRLCSLGAQGLWMRMLCIAAAHDPIGYVAVAGRGLDETALARMTGCSESEVSALLGELDRNGVFSRDRHGRIYSRRMTDDAKRSALARKNGKNGGNPTLRKQTDIFAPDKGQDKSPDKGCLKTQSPEARVQKKEDLPSVGPRKPKADRGSRIPPGWSPGEDGVAYARSLGATETECGRTETEFRDWFLQAAGEKGVKRDWPAAWRTWCRREAERGRFTGKTAQLALVSANGSLAQPDVQNTDEAGWRKRLHFLREREQWWPEWGPYPGQPGCLIPESLLTPSHREVFDHLAKLDRQRKIA